MEKLPDEIIVNILKYLNTIELINFCDECRNFEYFLRERKLLQKVDISKAFQFNQINVSKLINTRLEPSFIRILNINSLYWIPNADLLKVIKKLNNLKELYAMDTKLELCKNFSVYKNLSKLALTVTESEVEPGRVLCVKSLCLKLVLTKGIFNFQKLFNDKWQLEELWIFNHERVLNYEAIPYVLKHLKKFVIKTRSFSPFYDFRPVGLQLIFQCSRNESEIQFIYEKIPKIDRTVSIFDPIEHELEQSWEILHRFNKDVSCGTKEAKLIHLKEDLSNIYFEDLNFGHSIILCQTKYIEAACKILLSKNSCDLKRLHFRSCLFQKKEPTLEQLLSDNSSIRFKKIRHDMNQKTINDPFQNIAHNLTKLKELEIFFCSGCYAIELLSSYHCISSFENLEKLTLEVPLLLDGSFLKEVLIKCRKLWSLNLTITSQNEKFMSKLCENLKYSNALKDFRLDHLQIPIEKLLRSFNEINTKKLQRIFIKCDNLRYTSVDIEPFNEFLKSNSQLVFFFLIVQRNTVKQNSDIQKILNEHKKGNPAKIFYIKKDYSFAGYFPVPTAHHDIIYNHTNVSVVNLDEF